MGGGWQKADKSGRRGVRRWASLVFSEPPTPVVMWHGAGDWSASAPMERMRRVIAENTRNGTYIYSVVIGGDGGGQVEVEVSYFQGGPQEPKKVTQTRDIKK